MIGPAQPGERPCAPITGQTGPSFSVAHPAVLGGVLSWVDSEKFQILPR